MNNPLWTFSILCLASAALFAVPVFFELRKRRPRWLFVAAFLFIISTDLVMASLVFSGVVHFEPKE